MKINIQINNQFAPYSLIVNLFGITSHNKLHAYRLMSEALGLNFMPIPGDYFMGNEPNASELFRGKFSFPLDMNFSLTDITRLQYCQLKKILTMAYPHLIDDFLREETKCAYIKKYNQVQEALEKQQYFRKDSIFHDPIYVRYLDERSLKLREAIRILSHEKDPENSLFSPRVVM